MVKKPLSPGSSPQEFSTRHRRGVPSTRSTPVKSMAWFIADSPEMTRCSLVVARSTPNKPE